MVEKTCPKCGSPVPALNDHCYACGYDYPPGERERVRPDDGAPSRDYARPGVVTAAVVVAVWLGLGNIIQGLGHIQGVVETATRRGYPYDFRYAGLLMVGIMIVYSGVLFLWAVRGLARGERPAWDRALSGTFLLLLVAVPLIPLEGPGQDNAILQAAIPGAVSLIVLFAARPRLGTFTLSASDNEPQMVPIGAWTPSCGSVRGAGRKSPRIASRAAITAVNSSPRERHRPRRAAAKRRLVT
jgi:hypothetical protein